jgi:single-strand DNA-binding protein
MINQTVLTGRITRDLELKYTGTGTAVLSFSIAVERPFKNSQGERETDFIDIVAWRKTAENIAQYFKKGDGIGVVGRIQTRNYENNEGRKVYVTEVVADNFDFPIQNKSQQSQQQNNSPFENVDFNSNDPFETNNATEIDDDSLPF